MLKIYNTLSHKIEDFKPIKPPEVGYYSCGPTVYDYAHIGHARTFVFADILQRVLEFDGIRVKRVMNITDVGHLTSDADSGEDKMEKGAARENKTVWEIAEFYTEDFFQMLSKLNIKKPEIITKATDYVSAMIDLVKKQKEWDSQWGKGFPGWHIECSAMSMERLGETFDIHAGGVDHITIHHTNEIAQSEAATGKKFVNYWIHGEHLLVDGKKMSKSLGNFYRVEDIEKKGFSALALRYLFLSASYRIQMNFTWKSLAGAQRAYDSIKYQVSSIKYKKDSQRTVLSSDKLKTIDELRAKFTEAINDDLNMPAAVSVVWETLKSNIPSADKYDLVMLFDEVLGLELGKLKVQSEKLKVPEEILQLAKKREQLRKEKKFKEADEVRKELEQRGYIVEDTSEASIIKAL